MNGTHGLEFIRWWADTQTLYMLNDFNNDNECEQIAFEICDELWANGVLGGLRDDVISLFEKYGMNIRPDGKAW